MSVPFILVNLAGIFAFVAPLLMSTTPHGSTEAPWLIALLVPLSMFVALTDQREGGPKEIALVGVLAAFAAASRLPISFAGANLFFIVPIVTGVVFGWRRGFVVGVLGMAASAVITGGVGPWLPFQMWAAGWVGALASIARKPTRLRLAATGILAAFFYGIVMGLYSWPLVTAGASSISWAPGVGLTTAIERFTAFYVATSLGWDAVGAVFSALILASVGPALGQLMQRFRGRFTIDWSPRFDETAVSRPQRDSLPSRQSGIDEMVPGRAQRD